MIVDRDKWGRFQKGRQAPPTAFKKGRKSWNKIGRPILNCKICGKKFLGYIHRQSKYCSLQCCGIDKRGKPTWAKGKKGFWSEDKNGMWRGDFASPNAMHKWATAKKGKPQFCEHCGKTGKRFCGRWNMHWANRNHSYKRILDDYIGLCVSCHRKFDIKHNNYPIPADKARRLNK